MAQMTKARPGVALPGRGMVTTRTQDLVRVLFYLLLQDMLFSS